MNILFCWSGQYMGWKTFGKGFEQSSINLGLASLSAKLKQNGHYTSLLDCRKFESWEEINNILFMSLNNFDCVLIGFHSVDRQYADTLIKMIKNIDKSIPVIVGGVHVTFEGLKEFSEADCVVWGEGETVIDELINSIESNSTLPKHIVAPMVDNLDNLPFVDRELFDQKSENEHPFLPLLPKPFYTIMFSRGCTHKCSFCLQSKQTMWKKYRMRSPENCIEEIKTLMPIGSLMIHDDLFAGSRKWCERFLELWNMNFNRLPFWCQMRADWICRNADLIPLLAKIGLTWCSLGIEGSKKMLDLYNKKETVDDIIIAGKILHDNKVNIFGNYILGAPTETQSDIDELEHMLKEIKPEWHSASTYTYYKGSKLADFCEENNLLVGDDENNPDNHYSTLRFPYERKIKGIDYNLIREKQNEFSSKYRSELRVY